MYQVGYIERFGTGVSEMIRLSLEEGLKEPEFDFDGGVSITLWRPTKAEIRTGNAQETHRKDTENAQKPTSQILNLLKANAEISRAHIASQLGLTEAQVIYHLRVMKKDGLIKREGADKGGKWIVVE
jgi:ATP-dependent DNA helicase RecG